MKKILSPPFLLTTAVLVLLLSGAAFLAAVHQYCELRWLSATLALAAIAIAVVAVRQRIAGNSSTISVLTFLVALITASFDIYFVAWATVTCSAF